MHATSLPQPRGAPANKGRRYPADPPRVEEIVAVMRQAGQRPHGLRVRGLIVVLWRAGLRIAEALALAETDLAPDQGSVLVRSGKGGRRRVAGMDNWGWEQLRPWVEYRQGLPVGPLFCVISGQRPGSMWASALCGSACVSSQPKREFVAGLHRISSDTLMQSRWRERVCR